MALFGSKKVSATPAFASAPIQAAAGSAAQVGQFYTYSVGASQELALSVPTVARSIQMIASMVGCLELKHYTTQWTGSEYEELYLENESWMDQPDPKVTRNFIFSQLVTDLMLHGRGFWYITSRSTATGRPLSFQWLPAAMVSSLDMAGPQWFGMSDQLEFNGYPLATDDVVQFLAPTQGSMSAEDLSELAAAWRNARQVGAIGALNSVVTFKEFSSDPNKLQLIESRQFQALELSRTTGIPPYLLGIGVSGSYTYQNAQQARQDLYLFGTKQYLDAIEQTLSMNQLLPRGRYVKFDVSDYVYENDLGNVEREPAFDSGNREEEYS
jgi:phage portal protein BeeE